MPGLIAGMVERALARGLDVAALRHQVIANNIANVDTPHFKAKDVAFEETLRGAMAGEEGLAEQDLDAAQPTIYTIPATSFRNDGNTVDIDWETVKLAQNTGRYTACAEILRRRYAILRYVAREGR